MATKNPFDLLGDIDNDDPSQLLQSAPALLQKSAVSSAVSNNKKNPSQSAQNQHQKAAKLPSKPLPPSQAVREARNEGGRGRGRGRGVYDRGYPSNKNAFNNTGFSGNQAFEGEGDKASERSSYGAPREPYRGGRRDGFNDDEGRDGERPRRAYEGRNGSGRGSEFKQDGSGRGNWGSQSDEVSSGTAEVGEDSEKNVDAQNRPAGEDVVDGKKEGQPEETEEKEPEEKEMTLEEYEKLLEEKRKALEALKMEERKVVADKEFESMQQLSNKKDDESVFIKLGSDKDKKKEAFEKDKAKKAVSINEFLKPAEGERFYSGGRGRGRGRGPRGGDGYVGGNRMTSSRAPAIEDSMEFPTLGAPRA